MARKNSKTSKTSNVTETLPVVASPSEIAAALASIDTSMETAVTAGVVDHHSQVSSWAGADSEIVLAQQLDQLADFDETSTVDTDALAEWAEIATGTDQQLSATAPAEHVVNNVLDPLLTISGGIDGLSVGTSANADLDPTLDQLVAAQPDEHVNQTVYALKANIDGREKFEEDKSVETGLSNIFGTLKKVRTQMVTKRVAAVLNACQIDPAFINRVLHDGSRYNVYALGKLSDVVYGVSGGAITNAINLAVLKSLFICEEKGITFTKDIAKACCSKQFKIEGSVGAHLVRHTVSTSTAPTQASSTMQALATLGVVEIEGSSRSPVYRLRKGPMTTKIQELLAA